MRLLLLFILIITASLATERPKIGLVLSGGGARGGAHLGVIKMLEKHHIPIDMIVGTSMGAFIGGMYASGKDSLEIEKLLTTTQWNHHISSSFDRENIPFRAKQYDRDFPSRIKLGINSKNEMGFQTGLFSRQNMLALLNAETYNVRYIDDFDQLLIPFRAVATDIKNGEEVVLKSGVLSEAIYASIAVPGGFQPIVIDGKTLVDGGISSNLPLQAMREMHPDIIIVVDISTPFDENVTVDSYITVISQLNNILMRKNVEDTIVSMKKNEILITPELGDITPLDADKYPEIIKIGKESFEKNYTKFKSLSVDNNTYNKYLMKHRTSYHFAPPVIDKIILDNKTEVSDELIYSYLHVREGKSLNLEELENDILQLYNLTLFEDVTYTLDFVEDKTILKIFVTPSWNAHGNLRFGLGFEDDFNSNSSYTLAVEYTMASLNSYGGEWRSVGSIGKEKGISTELYQPLNAMREYFIRPYLSYKEKTIGVAPNALGIVSDEKDNTLALDVLEKGAGLGLGYNLNSTVQFEAGFKAEINELSGDFLVIDANFTTASYAHLRHSTESRYFYADFVIDSYDNAFFPTKGDYGRFSWKKEIKSIGGELDYSRISIENEYAFSLGSHTILPRIEYVNTYEGKIDINSLVSLGGFGRLSGYSKNAFAGDSLGLFRLNYRYNIYKDDFFGSFSAPLYVGGMAEVGSAWNKGNTPFLDDMVFSGNVYLASDTILGPCYFAYGRSDGSHDMFYFSLGGSF